MTMEKHHSEV
jgi:Lon-like ATP-dependent protease